MRGWHQRLLEEGMFDELMHLEDTRYDRLRSIEYCIWVRGFNQKSFERLTPLLLVILNPTIQKTRRGLCMAFRCLTEIVKRDLLADRAAIFAEFSDLFLKWPSLKTDPFKAENAENCLTDAIRETIYSESDIVLQERDIINTFSDRYSKEHFDTFRQSGSFLDSWGPDQCGWKWARRSNSWYWDYRTTWTWTAPRSMWKTRAWKWMNVVWVTKGPNHLDRGWEARGGVWVFDPPAYFQKRHQAA